MPQSLVVSGFWSFILKWEQLKTDAQAAIKIIALTESSFDRRCTWYRGKQPFRVQSKVTWKFTEKKALFLSTTGITDGHKMKTII